MVQSLLRFYVPECIESLEFADLPQSNELSETLERLQLERLGDLRSISLPEFRRVTKAAEAVTLELGCLIRRAKSGEFRKLFGDISYQPDRKNFWRVWPGDAPGEKIEIPEAATSLSLAVFEMSPRLRNSLHVVGIEHAGDLNGKEYRHFLRVPGIGVKTVQDLRKLVQQIREGRCVTPRPLPEKKPRVSQCFVVPETLRDVIPYNLHISARLDGVLRRMGIARLGDLHGMEFHEMHMMLGCGPKTLREALQLIERA